MKSLLQFINEKYEASLLSKFFNIFNKLLKNEYDNDNFKIGISVISKIFSISGLSQKQISKQWNLGTWKNDFFLNNEIYDANGLSKFFKIDDINKLSFSELKKYVVNKSTWLIVINEINRSNENKFGDIKYGILMDPEKGKDVLNHLREVYNKKDSQSNNDILSYKDNWISEKANKVYKEYQKHASKEQLNILSNFIKQMINLTTVGKLLKIDNSKIDYHSKVKDNKEFINKVILNILDKNLNIEQFATNMREESKEFKKYVENVHKKLHE